MCFCQILDRMRRKGPWYDEDLQELWIYLVW